MIQTLKKNIYWSSSSRRYFDDYIWVVDFHTAKCINTDEEDMNYVICIRKLNDGSIEWSNPSKSKMNSEKALEYANKLNKKENKKCSVTQR